MARRKGNALTPDRLISHLEFKTRRACREWIEQEHGYIRSRPDLKTAPHFWRVPRAVRVTVTVTED